MLSLKNNDNNYVLSLDKLDLNFLKQYVQRPADEKRVLWSKPSMDGELTYCEVQIPTEELEDDPFIVPSQSYICHICNIKVPRLYHNNHVKSRLHQTYKKLSQKFLENISRQMNLVIDNTDNNAQCDRFYCEICSKVVLTEHKQEHYSSTYHVKCIENQKLVENFVDIYLEHKEIDNSNLPFKGKTTKNDGNESTSDTDWNDSEGELVGTDNSDSSDDITIPKKGTTTSMATAKGSNIADSQTVELQKASFYTSNDIKHFQENLEEIITKYKFKFVLPIIEDNSIVIVAPEGYKEKITIEAFHSYKIMNNFAFCQLCEKHFVDMKNHNNLECHMKNIIQPINNYFAREMIGYKIQRHCLICNDIVNGQNHLHHKKVDHDNTSIIERPHSYSNNGALQSSSGVCTASNSSENSVIRTSNQITTAKSITVAKDKVTTGENVPSTRQAQAVTKLTKAEKIDEYQKQMGIYNDTLLECLVCDLRVPICNRNIIEHVEGNRHRMAVIRLLDKHKIKQKSFNVYECATCRSTFDDFVKHVNDAVHKVLKTT